MTIHEAPWIQGGPDCEAPLFRKEFDAQNVVKASIAICGLGYFVLYLNGKRVGNDELVPAWSAYEPRENRRHLYPISDAFTSYRTYYLEYDLLPYLQKGRNAVGILLGNGWYHQNRRNVEGDFWYGFPKLTFVLELTDAEGNRWEIISDEETKWKESEILTNNLYFGELHDLRLRDEAFSLPGTDDAGFKPVLPAAPPKTTLLKQECPADRIIRTIKPSLIHEEEGRRIYDCGENLSGWVRVRCFGAPGERVSVRHSEELTADGAALDYATTGGNDQIQLDEYLCSGKEETVRPHFCWHGFRFFEMTGPGEPEEAAVVHMDLSVTSRFSSSEPILNWLYDAYLQAQLTNLHGGVPSDCPHRERLGYTGDGQITARPAMLTLDARPLYDKWMEDIIDGQDRNSGHIQHTAPFYGGGGGPGGWGCAVVLVPNAYYEAYGDEEFLRKYYPNMRLWLDYLESRTENGLVTREEEGGWCLGDWCTPERVALPEPYVNTYYYLKSLRLTQRFAHLLGIKEDFDELSRRETRCVEGLRAAYLDPDTGSLCKGVNGADAFAVDEGFGDERTLCRLVERYTANPVLDTGIFGTDILFDVLFENGQAALAYSLLTSKGTASYDNMRAHGATTLWEHWNGGSHNHPMFGGAVRFLFTQILGIKQKEGTAGYTDVRIEPADLPGLSWAKGEIRTIAGTIRVSYVRREDGGLDVQSEILP